MEDSDNLDLDGELTEEERALENSAFEFIKVNKQELIKKFADPLKYQPVNSPVSLFMAGSPGAGKTEISKSLIGKFIDIPIRIDADEIRQMCPLYTGSNAHIFQKAANKGVNILFDHAIHKKLNLILDGTFAYAYAEENIKRSINKGRVVELWFVYQDPQIAWEFTKTREKTESRHVSKKVFMKSYFESKNNAKKVKDVFGEKISLNLLIKNYETNQEEFKLNINATQLDNFIPRSYTQVELESILK
jgi:predicted ABC-type ATPase